MPAQSYNYRAFARISVLSDELANWKKSGRRYANPEKSNSLYHDRYDILRSNKNGNRDSHAMTSLQKIISHPMCVRRNYKLSIWTFYGEAAEFPD
jgi:hypothetical protein